MTNPSPILVTPVAKLNALPQFEREIVSRFLFEHIKGLDDKHNRRWRRLWRQGWHAEPGEVFHFQVIRDRSGPFHRRHRAVVQRLFESQEKFTNIDALHDWLKVGACWVDWGVGRGGAPVAIPKSTSFEACSDDEMKELHTAAVDFLHTPRAQRKLWPHIKSPARAEMLGIILREGEHA